MIKTLSTITFIISALFSINAEAKISNFTQAKKVVLGIHHDHRITFYCGCKFDKHKVVNLKSCGYKPLRDIRQAKKLSFEHIVPAYAFGHTRKCWKPCKSKNNNRLSNRTCCRINDKKFKQMENDIRNLVPVIHEINSLRRHFSFTNLSENRSYINSCKIKIDNKNRLIEPPNYTKGYIARTYLYFVDEYNLELSLEQLEKFQKWNQLFPADDWEKEWLKRVEAYKKENL